jgi:cyclase
MSPRPEEMVMQQPRLTEVAKSIYAYVQPDGGWCLNNAGLIRGPAAADPRGSGNAVDGAVILIDTTATERRTKALAAAITQVAPLGPTHLVNTHFHGDHTFGNGYFKPRAAIIAHEACAVEQREAGLGLRGLWPDVDWGRTPVVGPDITYSDSMTLEVAGRRVVLQHPDAAHTAGDTVIWLPDDGVLFTGDIAWSMTTPFCLMGSVTGSIEEIARLRAFEPMVVVPGHGPVGGADLLKATESYLNWLLDIAAAGLKAGKTPLQAARSTDLGEFRTLTDSERIVGNLHRAYADLAATANGAVGGAAVDVAAAFAQMIEFNGGLPPCHA